MIMEVDRRSVMYQHHKESLDNLIKYFQEREGVIALIFGGSVAKGCERIDSDLDAMVIVSEEEYLQRQKNHHTAETIAGYCTYEKGYFDVKYMTKQFLVDAAQKGSEPTRNAFLKARVLFTQDPEIPDLVSLIPVFQRGEKAEKLFSFYADFWLNYYYFLKSCPVDGYIKLHAINEVIYSIYRIVLQEHEVLFPSNRRLEETVCSISEETAALVDLGRTCAKSQAIEDVDAFVTYFLEKTSYEVPSDIGSILSQYTIDFEQWWRVPRPNINEW